MLSKETIRKWTSSYFSDMIATNSESVTDEMIEQELSSERGHGLSSPSSLIHDEEFQLSARKYVREFSYVKGEPNLTVQQFTEWVESTYHITVHPETSRRWLHELGSVVYTTKRECTSTGMIERMLRSIEMTS